MIPNEFSSVFPSIGIHAPKPNRQHAATMPGNLTKHFAKITGKVPRGVVPNMWWLISRIRGPHGLKPFV
jgi:hypothetical protein